MKKKLNLMNFGGNQEISMIEKNWDDFIKDSTDYLRIISD